MVEAESVELTMPRRCGTRGDITSILLEESSFHFYLAHLLMSPDVHTPVQSLSEHCAYCHQI